MQLFPFSVDSDIRKDRPPTRPKPPVVKPKPRSPSTIGGSAVETTKVPPGILRTRPKTMSSTAPITTTAASTAPASRPITSRMTGKLVNVNCSGRKVSELGKPWRTSNLSS